MRLIDADAINVYYEKERANMDYTIKPIEVAMCLSRAIDNCPTIDPVKHGHWIYIGERDDLAQGTKEYCCSQCGKFIAGKTDKLFNYCNNCGAKMDEETEMRLER